MQHCADTLSHAELLVAGGDVCSAIQDDVDGDLSWYIKGHQIALDIARGLFFLHSHGVRSFGSLALEEGLALLQLRHYSPHHLTCNNMTCSCQ